MDTVELNVPLRGRAWMSSARQVAIPMAVGLVAGLGMLVVYLGIITWLQDWEHATQQMGEDGWYVAALALGFGAQVGLFRYLRTLHAQATKGAMAASTGTSSVAMLACCAHHVTDVLPILGVAGVAAGLGLYKMPLLWLGIGLNIVGVVYLGRNIRHAQRMACHHPVAGGE